MVRRLDSLHKVMGLNFNATDVPKKEIKARKEKNILMKIENNILAWQQ